MYPQLRKQGRMKVKVLATALAATLSLGGVAMAVDKEDTKKVESKVTLDYEEGNSPDPYDPYAEARFTGLVRALDVGGNVERKCENNRTVRVRRVEPGPDPTFGTAPTNRDGAYEMPADDAAEVGGEFRAKVERRKRNRININCLPDRSNSVFVPAP